MDVLSMFNLLRLGQLLLNANICEKKVEVEALPAGAKGALLLY